MNLKEWAVANGVHPHTAYRWFREVEDDLVRDMNEMLTSFCACLYGRRSAKNRANKALEAAACDG